MYQTYAAWAETCPATGSIGGTGRVQTVSHQAMTKVLSGCWNSA